MIRVHREGHQLFERHAILGIDFEQGRSHRGKFQALLDDLGRNEEGPCLQIASSPWPFSAQGLEGAELVERVQSYALHVFSQRVTSARISDSALRTMQGIGAVFASRFCSPAATVPGSGGHRQRSRTCRFSTPSASSTGRTFRL